MTGRDNDLTPTQRARALAREQNAPMRELATRQGLERKLSPTPVPWRITFALDYREMYGPEVDIACGVMEPAVDEWEAGTRTPTEEQVEALARLTGFPVSFFHLPEPPPLGPVWVCNRSARPGNRCKVIDDRPAAPAVPLQRPGSLPRPAR